MRARAFWKTVTADTSDLLDRFLQWLDQHDVCYCVIGGQAVNAYAEPVVSLDLDVIFAAKDLSRLVSTLAIDFAVQRFPHSLNIGAPGSDLRIQIQTDPRYDGFVARATPRDVLGIRLPVARPEDVLQGKLWALEDTGRRPSKRQKDLADVARLLEALPHLRAQVPQHVLDRLV